MILVTGAAGKTGRAVIKALHTSGESIRALIHCEAQAGEMRSLGVQDVIAGDMLDPAVMQSAFSGIRAVYHICSNMNPDEVLIGKNAIDAAKKTGVEHFVYHSVLHPHVKAMPHHWNKLQVEAQLFEAGMAYTIMQPAAYMQNILGYWSKMVNEGIYAVPYSAQCRFSLVDLLDVAQAAAQVITDRSKHTYAIYELCGHQVLTNADVARLVGSVIGREVVAMTLDRVEWEENARAGGMSDFSVCTLLDMFEYYDKYGFVGNANVLTWVLGRPPISFEEFLNRSAHHASTD